jgi:hypothetical protein
MVLILKKNKKSPIFAMKIIHQQEAERPHNKKVDVFSI